MDHNYIFLQDIKDINIPVSMISVAGYWPIKPSYLHLNCAWEYHRHGTPSSSAVSATKDSGTNLEQLAQHVRRLLVVWFGTATALLIVAIVVVAVYIFAKWWHIYCSCPCIVITLLKLYARIWTKSTRIHNYTYLWLPSKCEWYGLYYLINGCFRKRPP